MGEKKSFSSPHFHLFSYASCVDSTQSLSQPNASWRNIFLENNFRVAYLDRGIADRPFLRVLLLSPPNQFFAGGGGEGWNGGSKIELL